MNERWLIRKNPIPESIKVNSINDLDLASLPEFGEYGTCSCNGRILYYKHSGVLCSLCGRLYGIWSYRKN
jgi:hypothetical protein